MGEAASDTAEGASEPAPRTPEEPLRRGAAVVCVLTGEGPLGATAATVRSVRQAAAGLSRIVLCGSQARAAAAQLEHEASLGPARSGLWACQSLAEAAAAFAPADVVALQAGALVQAGWLESLRAAAYASPEVATASAIEQQGPGTRAPTGGRVAVAPRLRGPCWPCVYIRRSAIELAGAPDQPGFARRCQRLALAHVLAPQAFVTLPDACSRRPAGAGGVVDGPAGWARARARRAACGLTVALDARELQRPSDGTRAHLLALIAALGRLAAGAGRPSADGGRRSASRGHGDRRPVCVVVVDAQLDGELSLQLEGMPGIALVRLSGDGRPPGGLRADVVHRPHQVSTPADMAVLGALGERLVITQQDLISYQQPCYFRSPADWQGYRWLTRRALAVADRVVFFSEHVRREALAEGLVEPSRADVVPIGVDHITPCSAPRGGQRSILDVPLAPDRAPGPAALTAVAGDAGRELILCLGTDLAHKNRPFALRVAGALRARHGWRGRLVLAGVHVELGSSQEEERALLAADPRLAEAVVDLGPVGEAQKRWLLANAGLVLYPTINEGFGLIPFEAAACGVPCLWAPGTALGELLGRRQELIVPWDADAAAASAVVLMRDRDAREQAVATVRERARELSWDRAATELLEVYRRACDDPPAPMGVFERAGGLMGSGLSEDAVHLVGPGGALPRDLERPLLALATHPRIGRPVFGSIRTVYRLARASGRRRGVRS